MGCQEQGGFHDIALVKQAEKNLRMIRNAIEEYKIDHNTYPRPGTSLNKALAPYLSKTIFHEGKKIAKHTGIVGSAENKLNQIRENIVCVRRLKDEKIKEKVASLEYAIRVYEQELAAKPETTVIKQEYSSKKNVEEIVDLINGLSPDSLKKVKADSLMALSGKILSYTDRLNQLIAKPEAREYLENIKIAFEFYREKIKGPKPKKEKAMYPPEGEINELKNLIENDSLLLPLEQMVKKYRAIESDRDYYEYLLECTKTLLKLVPIFASYEKTKEEMKKSALILQAQATLRKMADVIEGYRKQSGAFPEQDIDIDEFLHPYFIETTISGEQIDRWEKAKNLFSSGPDYTSTSNHFILKAHVNDIENTSIQIIAEVVAQWNKITSAFAEGLIYETIDPKKTYFLKVKAKDSRKTILTDRPPVIRKVEK